MGRKTCEELYIKQIENGIRSIRLGSKKPEEVHLFEWFEKLAKLNNGMYQDLVAKYQNVVNDYERRKKVLR